MVRIREQIRTFFEDRNNVLPMYPYIRAAGELSRAFVVAFLRSSSPKHPGFDRTFLFLGIALGVLGEAFRHTRHIRLQKVALFLTLFSFLFVTISGGLGIFGTVKEKKKANAKVYTQQELETFIMKDMVALILEALVKMLMEIAGYYVSTIGGAAHQAYSEGKGIELRANLKLPLAGVVVYLDVRGERHRTFANWIEENGGKLQVIWPGNSERTTTQRPLNIEYYIFEEGGVGGDRLAQAERNSVPIVVPGWLTACQREKRLVDSYRYLIGRN